MIETANSAMMSAVIERVFPLIEADVTPVVAELVHGAIVRSELVHGGLTNTLRRVELADGRVLGVKHYVRGRSYATEGAALRELTGVVPVPVILCTLDRVIAYRWIDGPTLEDCRRREPSVLLALAAPLGQLLGALARHPHAARPLDLAPALARLERGPARAWLGGALADALGRMLEAQRFDDATGFAHGDFNARNVIVAPTRDRIAGVIDWEAATAGSALLDVGRLFRRAHRYGAEFRTAFARAHGGLAGDWLRRAQLLDAARLVMTLADDPALPTGHRELREVVARFAAAEA